MFDLGRDVKQTIVETDSPPKKIVYKGTDYFLADEFLGHCKSVNDDDEDGSDGKNLEEIWDEKDLLDEFVKPRKAKNFVIGHYYRKALGSLERS